MGRIVSSQAARRNIRGEIVNIFNARKMPLFQAAKSSCAPIPKFATKITLPQALSPAGENR
jgi:hypothetical protein